MYKVAAFVGDEPGASGWVRVLSSREFSRVGFEHVGGVAGYWIEDSRGG